MAHDTSIAGLSAITVDFEEVDIKPKMAAPSLTKVDLDGDVEMTAGPSYDCERINEEPRHQRPSRRRSAPYNDSHVSRSADDPESTNHLRPYAWTAAPMNGRNPSARNPPGSRNRRKAVLVVDSFDDPDATLPIVLNSTPRQMDVKPDQQTSEIGLSIAQSARTPLGRNRRKAVHVVDSFDDLDATLPIRVNRRHVVRPHNQRKSPHTVEKVGGSRSPSPQPIVIEDSGQPPPLPVVRKPRKVYSAKERNRTKEYERRRMKRTEKWPREAREMETRKLARATREKAAREKAAREKAAASPPQKIGAEKPRQPPSYPFRNRIRMPQKKNRDRTKEYDRQLVKRVERWTKKAEERTREAEELARETREVEEETRRWMTEELLAAREDTDEDN